MLRVRMLGGLSAQTADGPLTGSGTQPRRLAVLALIARAGDRGITRDKLLAVLWPDTDEESGRRALTHALYGLRREVSEDDLFLGVQDLKLNPDVAGTDVGDFERALAVRDYERAVAAYGGPFLDGFRLAGAGEFDRWMDEQRLALSHRYADALEQLARAGTQAGDPAAAARWWRRLAASDPLNARVAAELMRSLVAAGDRAGALQHARIYEALVGQDLDLPPDRQVVELAEEIRRAPRPKPSASPPAASVADAPPSAAPELSAADERGAIAKGEVDEESARSEPTAGVTAAAGFSRARQTRSPLRWAIPVGAVTMILAVGAAGSVAGRRPSPGQPPTGSVQVLAVGRIADFRQEGRQDAGPLADMLATNLSRIPRLQVVSGLRMLELAGAIGSKGTEAEALSGAARAAGATDLLEGGLHTLPGGRMLLDLRQVDMASGAVRTAYRAEGTDLYALVERITDDIARAYGLTASGLNPAQVTTSSLVAYRFYEEGLRAYARGDNRGARGLFAAALAEDSSFAMAAYYDWLAGGNSAAALRLADNAPDRERLVIRGRWAIATGDPAMLALAETLAIRYPREIDGPLLVGRARLQRGEFAEAIEEFRRVVALDSVSLHGEAPHCRACEALSTLVWTYLALDSLKTAEQLARGWTRTQPQSARAWAELAKPLFAQGKEDEAIAARRTATSLAPIDEYDEVFPAIVRLRGGNFSEADRMLRTLMRDGSRSAQVEARWVLAISLRYQGRPDAAIALLQSRNEEAATGRGQTLTVLDSVQIAQALLEAGRPGEARRYWEAIASRPARQRSPALQARSAAWYLGMAASAAAAEGNAVALSRLADSVERLAAQTVDYRALHIARHSRALVLLQRGDTTGAIREFRTAIRSPTEGFTRTNLEVARLLLETGRAAEAIPLLHAALHGTLEGGNLYVTFTELHALLGQTWEKVGRVDSAAANYRWVIRATEQAERSWQVRRAEVLTRMAALEARRR